MSAKTNSTPNYQPTQFERLYLSYIVSSDKNIDYPVAVIGYFRGEVGGYMLMGDQLKAHKLEPKGMYTRVVQKNPNIWNQLARWLFPFWGTRRTTSQKIGSLGPFLRCSLEIVIFRS